MTTENLTPTQYQNYLMESNPHLVFVTTPGEPLTLEQIDEKIVELNKQLTQATTSYWQLFKDITNLSILRQLTKLYDKAQKHDVPITIQVLNTCKTFGNPKHTTIIFTRNLNDYINETKNANNLTQ